jgi:UDP-N-acetylglucosamine 4,6-dehydratase/5-epimerase
MIDLNGKTVLVTGGTGSFGKKFTEIVLANYKPKKLIIFSRDEMKQYEMSQKYSVTEYPSIRYFIGDVRDRQRLYRAFQNVDIVVHAAAMKQVPASEYNPIEAIRTNIDGAINVIDACLDSGVEKCIALSTDKAANPINLYGATKLCSDKLFIAANAYSGTKKTHFAVVRYGNVVGSRGSVVPYFMKKRKSGIIPITDERMTRFWITVEQGVDFVLESLEIMQGGELFVPKIPTMNIMDLAKAVAPDCKYEFVGIRPGEKLHETMIAADDARKTLEFDSYYIIQPEHNFWTINKDAYKHGKPCFDGFEYSSETNTWYLSIDELENIIRDNEDEFRE